MMMKRRRRSHGDEGGVHKRMLPLAVDQAAGASSALLHPSSWSLQLLPSSRPQLPPFSLPPEDGGECRLARLEHLRLCHHPQRGAAASHVSEAKRSSTEGNIASDVSGSMQAALLDDAGKLRE